MEKVIRILSIDSGGIKGVIPSIVLQHLEEQTGQSCAEMFHLIAGTSTGALIAGGVCKFPHPLKASEIVDIFMEEGPKIFSRNLWRKLGSLNAARDEKYEATNLEMVLAKLFGSVKLSDITSTHLMIPAYEIEQRKPVIFRNWKAQGHLIKPEKNETALNNDFYLRDVVRASSAAPTYFEPAKIRNEENEYLYCIDGVMFAGSPVRAAITQARKLYPKADKILVVSLGTGTANKPIIYEAAKNWGKVGWLTPVLSILVQAQEEITDYDLQDELTEDSYYRFQINLLAQTGEDNSELIDDIRPKNLQRLLEKGHELVNIEQDRLNELVEKLKEPKYIPHSPRKT